MSTTLKIADAIITFAESKAVCPHCEREIPFEELESKWMKSKDCHIKVKCKCKRFIGVTIDIRGDFVAYELNPKRNE